MTLFGGVGRRPLWLPSAGPVSNVRPGLVPARGASARAGGRGKLAQLCPRARAGGCLHGSGGIDDKLEREDDG